MIKYIKIFFMLVMLLPFMSSCDWKELPAYEEADITGIQFRYRWASDSKDAITGEPVVKEIQLGANATINAEAGTIDVVVTVPAASANFPASARDAATQSKLWAQVTLSTAARLFPINGSAALGTPEDWTKPHSYKVVAANGKSKEWTIKITAFNK